MYFHRDFLLKNIGKLRKVYIFIIIEIFKHFNFNLLIN